MKKNQHRVGYNKIKIFAENILLKANLDEFSLSSVKTGLCDASLRGVDSHGVRLLPHYARSAISGRKNPQPKFKVFQKFPSILHLDADHAFGHAAGMKSMDLGMDIAKEQGICSISVTNSSHPGALASIVLRAATQGYIVFGFTHADALILSHNGSRPFFGTNPICFAAPRVEKEPFCLDMATSMIPWNKLMQKRMNGELLDDGLAADKEGNLTTNPNDACALMPMGSYKGYALASMVEVLCGIYSGMAFGRMIPPMFTTSIDKKRKLGQFYMVMRPDGVLGADDFISHMQSMTDMVRSEPGKEDQVFLPGDKEINESKIRLKYGIPIDDATMLSLQEIADQMAVPHLFSELMDA